MTKQKRYLGIELAGAKSQRTALAMLEYFPKEQKTFLLDVQTGIGTTQDTEADRVLSETLLDHLEKGVDSFVGVNVPLSLPPCLSCTRKSCPLPKNCTVPEVKWMKQWSAKHHLDSCLTPYTQRPVDLWLKQEALYLLQESPQYGVKLELDESLGSNKAPLAARMNMLQRHFKGLQFIEVSPKLSLALLAIHLKIPLKWTQAYRQLEEGIYAREMILEKIISSQDLFIYDRDFKKITQHLNAFDAFMVALTVKFAHQNLTQKPPKGFPLKTGWVHSPLLEVTS